MILVTFKTQDEVVSFYKHFSRLKKQRFKLILNGNIVGIQSMEGTFASRDKQAFISLFVDFILFTYEENWMLDYIKNTFYFDDVQEQTEILQIAHAIIEGQKEDIPKVSALPSRKQLIYQAIEDIVHDNYQFCFDSVVTFRLNEYKECLLKYVELAIDEYKLQQEYHLFVDKLRTLVQQYRPIHKVIHVIDEDPFVLFDEQLQEIEANTRIRSFYPILKQWGIDVEPSIMITLISLSPAIIHIYTNRRDSGLMTTIQKVFEDRIIFHPLIASVPLKSYS